MTRKKPTKKPTPPAPPPSFQPPQPPPQPSTDSQEWMPAAARQAADMSEPPQPTLGGGGPSDPPSHDWAVVIGVVVLGALVFVGVNKDWIWPTKQAANIAIPLSLVIPSEPLFSTPVAPSCIVSTAPPAPVLECPPPPPNQPHHQRQAVEQAPPLPTTIPQIFEPQMNDPTIWE